MSNLLEAIVRIHKLKDLAIEEHYKSRIRANNMGEALEKFLTDAFANTFDIKNEEQRNIKYSEIFSYIANQNNPPDAIIKGGDAIEVKKVESKNPKSIPLNSSYPKNKLFADSPMITEECRKCEEGWKEKDIIYAVGIIRDKYLKALCFVYGEDYAANPEIYERIKNAIKSGISEIPNIKFSKTTELSRVNRVDPLGITYLRVRGMWGIDIPFEVFKYITNGQKFFAIINNKKYNTFPKQSIELIEKTKGIVITDHKIKDSNNPAKLKDIKLISFKEII
ncbi:MAG: NgoPII family restriction endonuclease [Treponema sp.]|jgi:hypothetical protein|nr:NgoPII family restriction endonuclease [Treponema sp.]